MGPQDSTVFIHYSVVFTQCQLYKLTQSIVGNKSS